MFKNREEAGLKLASKINLVNYTNAIVYGITRGGIIVASKIADKLKTKLLPLVVKKIGFIHNPELAIAAVTFDKVVSYNQEILSQNFYDEHSLKEQVNQKYREVIELKKYLINNSRLIIKNKEVFLVDDGIATGSTIKAAIDCIKKRKAKKIIICVPVISKEIYQSIVRHVDELIALVISSDFKAVGQFYSEFKQVSNQEIKNILKNY